MSAALSVGDVFPNYPALCNHLGEPVKTGQAKIDQLKHWSQQFKWEKDGHKFTITEVIKPLTPREKLYHTESKWYPIISRLIVHMAAAARNGYGVNETSKCHKKLLVPSNQLYCLAGLCNPRFQTLKKGKNIGCLDTEEVAYYHKVINKKFYDIVSRILRSLAKRKVIIYNRPYFVNDILGEVALASFEEEADIIKIRDDLLEESGLKSESEVIDTPFENAFYSTINRRLNSLHPFLKSCYKVHEVTFPEEEQADANICILNREQLRQGRESINDKIIEVLLPEKHSVPEDLIDYAIRASWLGSKKTD
jgi:hypothetical protein